MANEKPLDLSTLQAGLKRYDDSLADASGFGANCATEAGNQVKVVDTFQKLVKGKSIIVRDGTVISVYFSYGNSAADIYLNVDGSGPKRVVLNQGPTGTSNPLLWTSGVKLQFMYISNQWHYIGEPGSYICTSGSAPGEAYKVAGVVTPIVMCFGTRLTVVSSTANTYDDGTIYLRFDGIDTAKIYRDNTPTTPGNTALWDSGTALDLVRIADHWELVGEPKIADVAKSGDYSDLENIPLAMKTAQQGHKFELGPGDYTIFDGYNPSLRKYNNIQNAKWFDFIKTLAELGVPTVLDNDTSSYESGDIPIVLNGNTFIGKAKARKYAYSSFGEQKTRCLWEFWVTSSGSAYALVDISIAFILPAQTSSFEVSLDRESFIAQIVEYNPELLCTSLKSENITSIQLVSANYERSVWDTENGLDIWDNISNKPEFELPKTDEYISLAVTGSKYIGDDNQEEDFNALMNCMKECYDSDIKSRDAIVLKINDDEYTGTNTIGYSTATWTFPDANLKVTFSNISRPVPEGTLTTAVEPQIDFDMIDSSGDSTVYDAIQAGDIVQFPIPPIVYTAIVNTEKLNVLQEFVSQAFVSHGVNPSGLNFDLSSTKSGTYWVNSNKSAGTFPSGQDWGLLLVFRVDSGSVGQLMFGDQTLSYRLYVNSTWRAWITV